MPVFRFLVCLIAFACNAFLFSSVALAESPENSTNVISVYSVARGAAAYDPSQKTLKFFELQNGALKETRRLPVEHTVWGVVDFNDGYIVASGFGRGSLDAPIRLWLFSKDGSTSKVVFEKSGERSQVTLLKGVKEKLWITFFDSKYITKTGYFAAPVSTPWSFTEKFSFRLGDAVDVASDTIAIGRPYGDAPGQDGDLAVYIGGTRHEVPTLRGVRAVRLLGDPANPGVLFADGWHQNYSRMAQGRLSLAKRDPATGTFTSKVVDLDPTQYGFSRLVDFTIGGKTYVAALGNKALHVYSPAEDWKRTVIYTRSSEDSMFDVALLKAENERATFVVLDKGLHVVSFKVG